MIVPYEKRHLHSHCIFLFIFIIFYMKIYVGLYEYKYRPKRFINYSLYIVIDKESLQCVENISGFISDR